MLGRRPMPGMRETNMRQQHSKGTRYPVAGRLCAWAAIAAAPMATWWLEDASGWTADQAVVVVVGGLGTGAAAYLSVTALALIAARGRPSRHRSSRVCLAAPRAWQRAVAVAMGLTLGSGITVPAVAANNEDSLSSAGGVDTAGEPQVEQAEHAPATEAAASQDESASDHGGDPTGPVQIKDGWQPANPSVESQAAVPPPVPSPPATDALLDGLPGEEPAPATAHYTVERGDSLWKITATFMGGKPSDAAIAATWPLLYDANREVIGTNPSLIHPGQVLTIPEKVRA
jgi:LysM repeat protein